MSHENAVFRSSSKRGLPPKSVVSLVRRFVSNFGLFLDSVMPPPVRLMDTLITGNALANCVRTLAALGIADALARGGPMTANELAAKEGLHAEWLKRLLLFAVEFNIFEIQPGSGKKGKEVQFRNSRISACLREDHPLMQRDAVLMLLGKEYCGWPELEGAIRTGEPAYVRVHGSTLFERMRKDPAMEELFSSCMAALDNTCGASVLQDFPGWRRFARFVDVGAALGSFTADLLQYCPHAEGVLFDQPQVIERARAVWAKGPNKELLERTSFVGGSFFDAETVPLARAGDAFILRQILHDWDDNDALNILRTLRQAFCEGAKLILVEALPPMPGTGLPHDIPRRARRASDLTMLATFGDAKERDASQMGALLRAAGFALEKVVETRSPFFVVVAGPLAAQGTEAKRTA